MVEKEKNKKWLGLVVLLVAFVLCGALWASKKVYFMVSRGESPTIVVTEPEEPAPRVVEPSGESPKAVVADPKEPELLPVKEVEQAEEKSQMLVLTPEQLAQANEMLAAFEGKPLNELVQVYGVMNMAATSVSPEDRPIFEFVLVKLGVYIAELEQQNR